MELGIVVQLGCLGSLASSWFVMEIVLALFGPIGGLRSNVITEVNI